MYNIKDVKDVLGTQATISAQNPSLLEWLTVIVAVFKGFKTDPHRKMLRKLKRIRKQLAKGKIDLDEYNQLRKKILNVD